MLTNAKEFNMDTSVVYKDAIALGKLLEEQLQRAKADLAEEVTHHPAPPRRLRGGPSIL
jgi:hypothetical protein